MMYFDSWREWAKSQQSNLDQYKVSQVSDLCIASVTLRNLKISIFGFLYRAKEVLETNESLKYVPMLHNNSSSLESVNSFLRACNRDCSISLPIGIVASNISGTNKIHINAQSYSAEDSHKENKNFFK